MTAAVNIRAPAAAAAAAGSDDALIASQGLVAKGAAKKVAKWLQHAPAQDRDAFHRLAAAIRQRAERALRAPPRNLPAAEDEGGTAADHQNGGGPVPAGRSGEVSVTVVPLPTADGVADAGPGPAASALGLASGLRPRYRAQFDGTLLRGGRRAEEALGAGELWTAKRKLQERLHARAGSLRAAWRRADPGMQGFLDADGLAALLAESDIPCGPEAGRALLAALDVDGDALVGFRDFCMALGDVALEERDLFAVSRRPGAMLANEPVIFGPPPGPAAASKSSDAGRAGLQSDPWAEEGRPGDSENGGWWQQLQPEERSAPAPAREGQAATATATAEAMRERRLASQTSNFRAPPPPPLRPAAFMPTRQPMRRTPALPGTLSQAAGRDADTSAGGAGASQTYDVLVVDDHGPPPAVRVHPGPGRARTRAGVRAGISFAADGGVSPPTERGGRKAMPDAAERPAGLFLMRPRTSMALYKEAVLPERSAARHTWD